ncbi:hypothetical protein BHE74_00022281 [Ensete ventricosum]|nr:hypothetical protein GW17_00046556 [Ensete ventricosum]RWW70073.1 hypothetical protein BHE74_00022281 [Ensete ventricosum]RZR97420.1 hypothetical protein BHM03_00026599 [Ensete ventricosum]
MVFSTLRTKHYEKDTSDTQLRENLNLLEERRVEAHLWELTYKKAVARLYNNKGKLAPTWEGLYRVVKGVQEGTCILANLDDKQLPRTWHISNLRKFCA